MFIIFLMINLIYITKMYKIIYKYNNIFLIIKKYNNGINLSIFKK